MPEVKRTIPLLGKDVEVADVPITKATENYSEYELEDGSSLRIKNVVTSILRVEGQFNPLDGSPVYLVLANPVTTVLKHRFPVPKA